MIKTFHSTRVSYSTAESIISSLNPYIFDVDTKSTTCKQTYIHIINLQNENEKWKQYETWKETNIFL